MEAHASLSCPTVTHLCDQVRQRLAGHPPPTRRRLEFRVACSPHALPVVLLVPRAYYQWPVHKSRRGVRRLPRRVWFSLVAHDSGDVTALGDFFQMSRWGSQSMDLDECFFGTELVPLLVVSLGGHAETSRLDSESRRPMEARSQLCPRKQHMWIRS